MIAKGFELRIPIAKLLIGAIATIVPLTIFSLIAIGRTETAVRSAVGTHFSTVASMSAADVSRYVHDRVLQVATLARMPAVVDEVAAANRSSASMSEAAFRDHIERTEKLWITPQAESLVRGILANPASRVFSGQIAVDRRFLRITLTDQRGAVIAASHKTLDYYQADEDFWQAIYAQGRGAVNLTDVLYDEVTKSNYIGIGVPIVDPTTNVFIGALDVLMEVSSIFTRATDLPGSSFRKLLVKDDGTIVSGPGITLSMNRKSPEHAAVVELFNSSMASGFAVQPLPGGETVVIGYADTGLRADYNNLSFRVLAVQNAREALSQMQSVTRLVWLMTLMSLAMVTLAIVYFSLNRRVRYEDIMARPPGEAAK